MTESEIRSTKSEMGCVEVICRIFGVLVGGLALLSTFTASMARIEGGGDLEDLIDSDVVVGGFYSLAFVLLAAPSFRSGSVRHNLIQYVLTLLAAGLLGVMVSVNLIQMHEEQFRARVRHSTNTE